MRKRYKALKDTLKTWRLRFCPAPLISLQRAVERQGGLEDFILMIQTRREMRTVGNTLRVWKRITKLNLPLRMNILESVMERERKIHDTLLNKVVKAWKYVSLGKGSRKFYFSIFNSFQ